MEKLQTYSFKIEVPEWLRIWQFFYNSLVKELTNEDALLANTPMAYERQIVDNKARLADRLHCITNKDLWIQLLEQLKI